MNYPLKHSLECLLWTHRFFEELIGFERSVAAGNHDESGPRAFQSRDLNIPRIDSDIGIGERTFFIGLSKTAIGENVIEHHRNTESADLYRLVGFVLDFKVKSKPAVFDHPVADHAYRTIIGKSR